MYPPSDGYQKFSGPPQPTQPYQSSQFYTQSTGIPVGSAMQVESQTPRTVPWSTGLFGCFEDCANCCITCWCPCITFGQIAEIIDRGASSCGTSGALYGLIMCLTGCSCLYSCFYRSKMRGQYHLQEKPCADCLIHCCCEYCALCQEYRELKNRGFDMPLGWNGNMEKQTPGATVPPGMESGMSR